MAQIEPNYVKKVLTSQWNLGFVGIMVFLMLVINFIGFGAQGSEESLQFLRRQVHSGGLHPDSPDGHGPRVRGFDLRDQGQRQVPGRAELTGRIP